MSGHSDICTIPLQAIAQCLLINFRAWKCNKGAGASVLTSELDVRQEANVFLYIKMRLQKKTIEICLLTLRDSLLLHFLAVKN